MLPVRKVSVEPTEAAEGLLPAQSTVASHVTAPESTHPAHVTVAITEPVQVTVTSLTSVADTEREPSKVEAAECEQEIGSIAAVQSSYAPESETGIHQSAPLMGDPLAPGCTAPGAEPGVAGDACQAAVPAPDIDQPADPVVTSATAGEASDMAVDEIKVCNGKRAYGLLDSSLVSLPCIDEHSV